MRAAKAYKVPWCQIVPGIFTSLSEFFALIDIALAGSEGSEYWFRGHSSIAWELRPSALRYPEKIKIANALAMRHEFRRLSINKIDKAPPSNDELSWLGLGQHYGLPTRFLDWTKNPAIALYFAVNANPDKDGCVYMMNPYDLNFKARGERRILDGENDKSFILRYLKLKEKETSKGLRTVAINPLYNSERILLQRGAFTLHGSQHFSLDNKQASSLVCIPISRQDKKKLRIELARIGLDQMSIFPEPEHVCNHLIWHHLDRSENV